MTMTAIVILVMTACSGVESEPSTSSIAATTATTAAVTTTTTAATTTTIGFDETLSEAQTLLDSGDLADALTAVERALGISPDDPAALDLLGRTRGALGDSAAAVDAFRAALAGDPTRQDTADRLGAALLDRVPASELLTGTEHEVGVWPEGITVTPGSIWVANSGSRSVTRLDATDLSPIDTVAVGRLPVDITTTPDGTIWTITRTDNTLWQIDPTTATATAETTLFDYASGLTHDPSGNLHMVMWVNSTNQDLALATWEPVEGLKYFPSYGLQAGDSIAYADGRLWITSFREGLIVVDPITAEIEQIHLSGRTVLDIATRGDDVFVLVGTDESQDAEVYRMSPDDPAPVFLATVDNPDMFVVSQTITAIDGYVIVVRSDGVVTFVVADVPGYVTPVPTDLSGWGDLGGAIVIDTRLIFSAHRGDATGVVVAIDIGPLSG